LTRGLSSSYVHPVTGTSRIVPGIVITATSTVMRTEDVIVEALIGEQPALDGYAMGLQEEEIRSRRLANERQELDNRLLGLAAERQSLLLDLVRSRDTEVLALYSQALDAVPSGTRPRRVLGVWEPEAASANPGVL
jgi:hypothetical protein